MSAVTSIWQRLLSDRRAVFGLIVIASAVTVSILGAYIRPDKSLNANEQNLALARARPMSEYSYLLVPDSSGENGSTASGFFFGGLTSLHFKEYFDSLYIETGEVVVMLDGYESDRIPLSTWPEVNDLNSLMRDHSSTRRFLLGTDAFGRDLLSRLMSGTIVSLSVGLISVLISLLIGVTLGAIAGYYGGRVDDAVMWLINVIWSIPTLLMVIAITLVMGKGFIQVFIAVGLTMWVEVARIVRGQVMGVKQLDYVKAGKVLGFNDARVIFKHILPNVMSPVIVISAANFASAILIEAGLSFLGIGTQIPMSSWGMMIKDHYPYITTDLAYLAILPGLCIILLVMAFMLLGNGLRDALDVKRQ